MDSVQINNHSVLFQPFDKDEIDKLLDYLIGLSTESKKRFGPHPFTKEYISQLLHDDYNYFLYTAKAQYEQKIIAYTILKRGWLDFEYSRLYSYGLSPAENDFTIAPSVADAWHGKGLGTLFMQFLIDRTKEVHVAKRLILWGGVQSDNNKAVKLYQKVGFRTLGQFEYNGVNLDMIMEL